eukprot:10349609-Heterocapsa_arctica.AAC.1
MAITRMSRFKHATVKFEHLPVNNITPTIDPKQQFKVIQMCYKSVPKVIQKESNSVPKCSKSDPTVTQK